MLKSLVTGCAGFIGSHVADALASRGQSVVGLDDLSGGFIENINPAVEFVRGSVTDADLVDQLFARHQFDFVYHLAAYAAEGLSHFIRRFNYTNNLIGSVNLINASVNAGTVRCFVFTSSIAVYGRGQLPMTEDMVPQPEDPYGISKSAVEQDLRAAHELFGLNSIVFRPHNVYGERQNLGDPYRNVVGIFLNQIMQGQRLTVFGDGRQTRAFSHVDDVAPIIAESVEHPGAYNKVFNIGADQPYSILELADVIGRAMGTKAEIQFLPARNEVVHAYSDHARVLQHFGHLIRNIGLDEGVARMVDWSRRSGPRTGEQFSAIEIEKKLPPSWAALAGQRS